MRIQITDGLTKCSKFADVHSEMNIQKCVYMDAYSSYRRADRQHVRTCVCIDM